MSLLTISMVSASHSTTSTLGAITDVSVEINDEELNQLQPLGLTVEKGEKLDIEVKLENNGTLPADDARNIEVVARLSGYTNSNRVNLEDSTAPFDVRAGTTKTVNLEVTVPQNARAGEYKLRVQVLDGNSAPILVEYPLYVVSPSHSVDIKDVSFSPGNTVKAGQTLLTNVLVKNLGEDTEEDVKVTVSIPTLGISAADYITDIESEKSEESSASMDEFFLQIPANTAAGSYDVVIEVAYDDATETVSETYKINVVANEMFQSEDKLVLAVGPNAQTVAAGKTATYGIALSNEGRSSKAYTISAMTGGDWATASVSESLVVLEAGKSKVVYVNVAVAADAQAGEHVASVEVKSADEVLETIALKANVAAGTAQETVSLRNGLEIAMVVLVVVLVIIGLIVGFSRLRKDGEEDQTYY